MPKSRNNVNTVTRVLTVLLVIVAAAGARADTAPRFGPAQRTGKIECPEVTEASGLAASRKNANAFMESAGNPHSNATFIG